MEENKNEELTLTSEEQRKLEDKIYSELCAPFDMSCYSIDSSRGFDLTSLKAAFVFDRLNLVLGLTNWQFSGNFERQDDGGAIFFGQLVIKIGDRTKIVDGVGFGKKGKNPADTLKSAQTDALSKCASYVGVAIDAFKGLVDPKAVKNSSGNKAYAAKKPVAKATPKKEEVVEKPVAKKSFIKPKAESADSEDW